MTFYRRAEIIISVCFIMVSNRTNAGGSCCKANIEEDEKSLSEYSRINDDFSKEHPDEPEDPSEFDYVIEFRDSEQIKNLNEIRCQQSDGSTTKEKLKEIVEEDNVKKIKDIDLLPAGYTEKEEITPKMGLASQIDKGKLKIKY